MIAAEFKFKGDKDFIKRMNKRLSTAETKKPIKVWSDYVRNKRILKMYKDQGSVRGEQGRWAKLSKWTAEVKGTGRSEKRLISKKGYRFGAMVRSYVIDAKRQGLKAWKFTLTNRARSKEGFDYPSALHTGWPEYTVKPKKPKGVLAWKTAGGDWHVYKETHPGPAPARPHIKFFEVDSRTLLRTMVRWAFDKRSRPKLHKAA